MTAVQESAYYDHDYYPLCNTHFCRLLLCNMTDQGQPEPRYCVKRKNTVPASLSARNTGSCASPYENRRFELDRKKVQSKKLFNFQF